MSSQREHQAELEIARDAAQAAEHAVADLRAVVVSSIGRTMRAFDAIAAAGGLLRTPRP